MLGGWSGEQVNSSLYDSLGAPNIVIHALSLGPTHLGPALQNVEDRLHHQKVGWKDVGMRPTHG